jgi:hypothetical protein
VSVAIEIKNEDIEGMGIRGDEEGPGRSQAHSMDANPVAAGGYDGFAWNGPIPVDGRQLESSGSSGADACALW